MDWNLLGGTIFMALLAVLPVAYIVWERVSYGNLDLTMTGVGGAVFFAGLIGLVLIANKPNIKGDD